MCFLFTLTSINYADRVTLSVAAKPVSDEFGLDKVQMGYLLSSFLWVYVFCLIPVGLLVDRYGGKIVNARGIGLWSLATVCTGLAPSHLVVSTQENPGQPHRHGHGRVHVLAGLQPHHP